MQDYNARKRSRGAKKGEPLAHKPKKAEKIVAFVPNETEQLPDEPTHKPERKPRKRLGLKIACCVLAVLLITTATLGHVYRYELLKYRDERNTTPVTVTDLYSADPSFAVTRYAYTPVEYTSQIGSGYTGYENLLGIELAEGIDFLTSQQQTVDEIKAQIKGTFEFAGSMNAGLVIIPLQTSAGTLLEIDGYTVLGDGALAQYAVSTAHELGLKIALSYSPFEWQSAGETVVLDPSLPSDRKQSADIAKAIGSLGADMIILRNCRYGAEACDYSAYASLNIGMGFELYKRTALTDTLYAISEQLRISNADVNVGLQPDTVWRLSSATSEGIGIEGDYEDYTDGYADTKAWLSNGLFDFVKIEDYGSLTDDDAPFETVADWWSTAAQTAGTALFITHDASKIASSNDGWGSYDQLPKQILAAMERGAYSGSVLYTAARLQRYGEIAAVVTDSFEGNVDGDDILRNLVITYPTKKSSTTYESKITLSGSSDPNFSVYINGELIERTSKGYFSLNYDLDVGKNTFKIEHKGSSTTYTVERKVLVIKSVDPTEAMTVYAGTQVVLSAVALKGSEMYASVDGKKVKMVEDAILLEESTDSTGDYINYTGVYTIDENSKSRKITGIEINGDWNGYKSSKKCADVTVKEIDKTTVRVATVTDKYGAEVFRYNTVDDKSTPVTYALPYGTRDFIIGETTYQFTSGSSKYVYVYYLLQSGKRVYKSLNGRPTDQISVAYGETVPGNEIGNVAFEVNSKYTTVKFAMSSKVPFTLEILPQQYADATSIVPDFTIDGNCSVTYVKITFSYTSAVATMPELENSPLFSSASGWQRDDDGNYYVTLPLYGAGKFFGVYGEYKGDELVFQFNNPPVISAASNAYGYSLAGVTVVLDPGHGGVSPTGNTATGAIGANPNYPEKRINLELGLKIKSILEGLGAKVYMTRDDDSFLELEERGMEFVYKYRPDIFISIHHNWADTVTAIGTDSFYYMPFSKNIAGAIYQRMFKYYQTSMYPNSGNTRYGRGVQYYPFGMTRYWYCPSTLVEFGFMSNAAELQKLIDPDTQWGFAKATVNGIIDYIKTFGTVSGTPVIPDYNEPGIIETEEGFYDEDGNFTYWEPPTQSQSESESSVESQQTDSEETSLSPESSETAEQSEPDIEP